MEKDVKHLIWKINFIIGDDAAPNTIVVTDGEVGPQPDVVPGPSAPPRTSMQRKIRTGYEFPYFKLSPNL